MNEHTEEKPKLNINEKDFLNGFEDAPHFTDEELRQATEPEPEPEKTGLDFNDGLALANTALTVTESTIQKFIHERFHFDEEQAARTAAAVAPLILKYQGSGGEFFSKWGIEIMAAVACLGLTFSSMSIIKQLKIEDMQKQGQPAPQPAPQPPPENIQPDFSEPHIDPITETVTDNNSSPSKESPLLHSSNGPSLPGESETAKTKEDNKKENAA